MKNFFKIPVSLLTILVCTYIFFISQQNAKADAFEIYFGTATYTHDTQTDTFSINCGDIINLSSGGTLTFIVYSYSFSISNTMYLSCENLPPGAVFPNAFGLTYVQSTFTWTPTEPFLGILVFQLRGTANVDCSVTFDWPLPVELELFTSAVQENDVTLHWQTSSENNNSGYLIERSDITNGVSSDWIQTGSVPGRGTTNSLSNYIFTDRNLNSGVYQYRLKQTDYNGNFEYHYLINDVRIGLPDKFELSQNYPNPFNPSTNLDFGISEQVFVTLIIYDASGKEIATLINDIKPPGYYTVNFNAAGLSSGIYIYRVSAGKNFAAKRMILVK